MGSPALASSRNSVSDIQWDLIVEGSNHGPELEPTTHIGYALGHARVATDEGGDWRLDSWETSANRLRSATTRLHAWMAPVPTIGASASPICWPSSTTNRSFATWCCRSLREVVSDPSERDLFGIQIVRPVGGPTTARSRFRAHQPFLPTRFPSA